MLVDIDINKNAKVRVHKIHITGLDSLQKGETVSKLKRAMKKPTRAACATSSAARNSCPKSTKKTRASPSTASTAGATAMPSS